MIFQFICEYIVLLNMNIVTYNRICYTLWKRAKSKNKTINDYWLFWPIWQWMGGLCPGTCLDMPIWACFPMLFETVLRLHLWSWIASALFHSFNRILRKVLDVVFLVDFWLASNSFLTSSLGNQMSLPAHQWLRSWTDGKHLMKAYWTEDLLTTIQSYVTW